MCGGGGPQNPSFNAPSAADIAAQAAATKAATDAEAAKSGPFQKKKAQSLLAAYNPAASANDSNTTSSSGSTGKTTLGA